MTVVCTRVIAALWGSDGLGLNWHRDRPLIPAKVGTKVSAKITGLSDWMYMRDGTMVGVYTVKVLAPLVPPEPKPEPKPPARGGK